MLTYQVRPRVLTYDPPAEPQFPAQCVVRFHLAPLQAFGLEAGGGLTARQGSKARVFFNANTGQHSIESTPSLEPIETQSKVGSHVFVQRGNIVEMHGAYNTSDELETNIGYVYFVLPGLLNLSLADPPTVLRVEGTVSSSPFRWELASWRMQVRVTNQEKQSDHIAKAWARVPQIGDIADRRLAAAILYAYKAIRLHRVGASPGEFLAEALLNYAKCLEVLFPPQGDGKTRDAIREGLSTIGFSDDETERQYLPVIALRNEMDVGHVSLSDLPDEDLLVIHAYTEGVEEAFRKLLDRCLDLDLAGQWSPPKYLDEPASEAQKVIARMRENQAKAV